jgi:aminopeptidase-like protein
MPNDSLSRTGRDIYELAKDLFPICRSITGDGVRDTLRGLRTVFDGIKIREVPTGAKVFDWTIPKEWNARDAWIECPDGSRIAEFKKNNLHLVGYSVPADRVMTLDELQKHLYSLPEQPSEIPYITSYYKERFGFCIAHDERVNLKEGIYRAYVDSELKDGFLSYGEIVIPGEREDEIFFSANICHPSMANNELSGPCVEAHLARWISGERRRFTYRLIFVPETIGSIAYLSENLGAMKKNVKAGFNLTCIGDPGNFSLISSRYGDTLADRAAGCILSGRAPGFKKYSFLDRGSDERQYCAPFADLPVCCVTRTRFSEFSEYHTSADNMDFITAEALGGSFGALCDIIEALEANRRYIVRTTCEPQLSRYGLYPSVSEKNSWDKVQDTLNCLAYCDGRNDLFGVSELINVPVSRLIPIIRELEKSGVIEREKPETGDFER